MHPVVVDVVVARDVVIVTTMPSTHTFGIYGILLFILLVCVGIVEQAQ